MEGAKLDWLSHSLNYSIILYIFVKSLKSGTLNLFDTSISLTGLITSIMIFIHDNFLRKY